ncbi:class I SAM-dependent methyltransferase [Parasphingorhabdus sp. JC815]|uniref:class I SAM-dependent methyltransferase n=1 Tax=Parasphingorhabdus sp. JC815 TaxID=3232140 RepID=UPI003458BE00
MSNEDQIEYWNDNAGLKWTQQQDVMDRMLAPVTSLLMDAAAIAPRERVLDIGCGTGETSLIAVEAGAEVTGVDVSKPMLDLARSRVDGRAEMLLTDASEYRADEGFDLIISRFGVMFFEDPVAAFSNIKTNLKPGGRMVFACWQEPKMNQWMMVPMQVVKPFLPEAPATDPHAPGPFAFADAERLKTILSQAGCGDVSITPHSIDLCLTQSGGAEGAVNFSTQIGPASRALAEVDDAVKPEILKALEEAFAPHDNNGQVTLDGGIWIVRAS